MLPADLVARGSHVMTVCNACRYCEQYCPVFPALEKRRTFQSSDLAYLANLCHNCGECLYACQYAPPHEFGINVPRTLAEIRVHSYEAFCWPPALAAAFRQGSLRTSLGVWTFLLGLLLFAVIAGNGTLLTSNDAGDFYSVVPHDAMVAIFGLVSLFVLLAIGLSAARFLRDGGGRLAPSTGHVRRAVRDGLTLRHLQSGGMTCTSNLDARTPWRRWSHHCTFYGFALCFASTTVAAVYHGVFGWPAPYGYTSVPVLLGTAGGLGLLVGPAGLAAARRLRDPELTHADARSLDTGFLMILFLTSLTGLALLALRHTSAMGLLLILHLSAVLALFVSLPYGKFVHALYRLIALVRYHSESGRSASPERK